MRRKIIARKSRKEQERQEAKDSFNKEIFKAISALNSEELKASSSQINKYFDAHDIPKATNYDISLNTPYLNSLVEEEYLKIDETQEYPIYLLTKQAKDELSPKKPKTKEVQKTDESLNELEEIEEMEEIEDKEDFEKPERIQDDLQSPEDMQGIKTEELIKCPKCDLFYPKTEGSCPTCGYTQVIPEVTVKPLGEGLIPCPNPACKYMCRPDWEECPICNTPLKSIKTPAKKSKAKAQKKVKPLSPQKKAILEPSPPKAQEKHCIYCGQQIQIDSYEDKTSILYCSKCETNPERDTYINYCPSCGKKTTTKFKFCVQCHRSFVPPNPKFDKCDTDQLYTLSRNTERTYSFLLIFSVQFVLISLFIANLLLELGLADGIEFDLWDYFIPPLVFAPLLLYYQRKRLQLKKERVARDPYYRIMIATIQNRQATSEQIPKGQKGQLWKRFRQKNYNDIKEKIEKTQKQIKLRPYFWLIFIGLVITSIIFIIVSYTVFLGCLIGALCFLYLIIRKIHLDPLTEAFRLGLQYTEQEFTAYILYVITQLYNLIPMNKKTR